MTFAFAVKSCSGFLGTECRHYVRTDLLYEFGGELVIWMSTGGVVGVVVVVTEGHNNHMRFYGTFPFASQRA